MYGRSRVNVKVERGNVFALNLKLKKFFFLKKESEKRILTAFPICLIPDQCEILTDAITQPLYKHGKIILFKSEISFLSCWVWKVQKVEMIKISLKKKKEISRLKVCLWRSKTCCEQYWRNYTAIIQTWENNFI